MKSTIDAAGRLVIPKEIRRRAGLIAGAAVEIRFENGLIEIQPLSVPIRLVQQGQFLVAVGQDDLPPLRSEVVAKTLDVLRQELGGID